MSDTTPTPKPAEPRTVPDEMLAPLDALKRYGMPLAVGIGIAVVISLGVTYFRNRAAGANRDALLMMSSARSFDELERVVTDFGRSPAAPLALVKLAHGYYSSGNYALAKEKYDAFLLSHGEHPMAPIAEVGALHCVEAQGEYEQALAGFAKFVEQHPDHYLASQAAIGQGRCLEQLGRLTQARIVYEQFIATQPNSAWTRRVEELLRSVNQDIAAGRDGVPKAPAPIPERPAPATAATAPFFTPLEAEAPAQPAQAQPVTAQDGASPADHADPAAEAPAPVAAETPQD